MAVPTMRKGDVYILYPRGPFDRKMSAELETKIYELNSKERADVLLNLKRVKGILSHGVHTLVEMYGRCEELGGTIKLCGLKRDVRFVIEFTKLNEVFDIYEDEEEAWKSFSEDKDQAAGAGGAGGTDGNVPPPEGSQWKSLGKGGIRKPPKKT